MKKFEVGDLVHVPSEVVLFNENTTCRLNSPASLLITGIKDSNYEVFFNGERWLVKQNSVYKMGEKNAKTY